MHYQLRAVDIARTLTARGHTNSLTGPTWRPGHRSTQASPKTVRLWHDGLDEAAHLDRYAAALQAAGYTVAAERPAGKRPCLRVTKQTKEPS
ncbi:hypothetical protein CLM62_12630 [Streptomyces sp. SA15]|uniref:hypothetical protein n=1 Tax=Streptomyces sp. SA15 TaxID=934019 RepID=UPI000BB0286F|nr:hypothetical protein [Streptomyces sp. SA15]PAZ15635.1 hypothetical protein CLM62_12630 [Streptomyces sp. SA15]